ncbi:MAG: glycosyltransferase family 4 protein [Clostridia bacterium]|nr:glycosyltransferase family 4 protein [Clostridia bacterium]
MPKLLIVSPSFQPVNTPDMHRVRLSIPFFQNAGWDVTVLAVQPEFIDAKVDPVLEFLSDACEVIRVKAFPLNKTRKFGLGNLGYRSWFQLKKAGDKIFKNEKIDLVYFSTTVFPVMTLGRVWKKKFKTPFILDIQDPWRNDFYLTQPKHNRPPKYKIAHFLDSLLEKWTVPYCDGIVAVSASYPATLNHRYSTHIPSKVITFAASTRDFDAVQKLKMENPVFKKDKNTITLVYTGAVTPGMPLPLEAVLNSVKAYVNIPNSKTIKLYFIGTSYANSESSESRVMPLVKKINLEDVVFEQPEESDILIH